MFRRIHFILFLLCAACVTLYAAEPVFSNADLAATEIEPGVFVLETSDKTTLYLVEGDSAALLIDTGTSIADLDKIVKRITTKPFRVVATHGHFDHVLGVEHLRKTYGIPFALSGKDAFMLDTDAVGSTVYGVKINAMPTIDIDLDKVEEVKFGHTVLRVIRTPGHTPGHVSLYEPESKSLFTGDTLFRESIGRTDLPGGDYSWIMRSILDNLLPLGDEVRVYPGHGPETTIGHEVLYNPFVTEVLNQEVNYKN